MDFRKKHKIITQSEYTTTRDYIIEQLKEQKGRTPEKAISNVRSLIYLHFIESNIIEQQMTYFKSSCDALSNHMYNYDPKDGDPILKTLENEVFENFTSTLNTFKKYNIEQENYGNMTFDKFVPEILKLVVYKRCYERLDNSIPNLMEAFKLFYETNNYDDFSVSLLYDNPEKITTQRIQKIFKKYGKKLQIDKKSKVTNEPNINEINRNLIKYKKQISKLNDDEKAVLMYICISKKYNLDYTEKIKLILMSEGMNNDYMIFEDEPYNNDFYNKVLKSIQNKKSKANKELMLENILEKIDIFNLPKTKDILISIKNSL